MSRHLCEIRLRWGDMDAYQHVNNVSWATYVQEARAQLFAFCLRGTPGESLLGSLVVARARFWYQRPLIVRPEPLIAHTWISELRAAAITVECELRDGEGVQPPAYCRGRTVLAPFDFAADRLRRLTPEETGALETFLEAPESATDEPAADEPAADELTRAR